MRSNQLRRHPYCQCPRHRNKKIKADTVDHIKPHRGDPRLFWSVQNLQSLTRECHSGAKQKFEKTGVWPGCDESGMPEDEEHHWNLE